MQQLAEQQSHTVGSASPEYTVTDDDVYYVMDATETYDYQVVVELLEVSYAQLLYLIMHFSLHTSCIQY